MAAAADVEDLVAHLERTTALSRGEASRVVGEVFAWCSETADDVIRRRHRELQRAGVANAEAFERIREELAERPVAAPALSTRQVRRTIYG